MDTRYINPFIEATISVLETMAFVKARAGDTYLKKSLLAAGDVSGLIGVTGDAIGTFSISFSENSILSIVSKMFGEDMGELNEEVKDAVGEIANMICGMARQKLEVPGLNLAATIPVVIMGKDHSINHITDQKIVAVPFSTDDGQFAIELCFEG